MQKRTPLEIDINQISKLYEESKDIIHGVAYFNVSKEAKELLKKIEELAIVAVHHAKSKQNISKN